MNLFSTFLNSLCNTNNCLNCKEKLYVKEISYRFNNTIYNIYIACEKCKYKLSFYNNISISLKGEFFDFCYGYGKLHLIGDKNQILLSNPRKEDPALQGGDEFSYTLLLLSYSIT